MFFTEALIGIHFLNTSKIPHRLISKRSLLLEEGGSLLIGFLPLLLLNFHLLLYINSDYLAEEDSSIITSSDHYDYETQETQDIISACMIFQEMLSYYRKSTLHEAATIADDDSVDDSANLENFLRDIMLSSQV